MSAIKKQIEEFRLLWFYCGSLCLRECYTKESGTMKHGIYGEQKLQAGNLNKTGEASEHETGGRSSFDWRTAGHERENRQSGGRSSYDWRTAGHENADRRSGGRSNYDWRTAGHENYESQNIRYESRPRPDYVPRKRANNWKAKRRRKIRRQICMLGGAVLILAVASVSILKNHLDNVKEEEAKLKAAAAEAEAEKTEYIEEPFVNILEEESSELSLNWDGPIEKQLYENMTEDLESCIATINTEGYSTAFLLYDINTGGGISYCPDDEYYSASAIKGPYVVWLAETYPETAVDMYSTIADTISWSSNSDYFTLINTYGKDGFASWTAELGSPDIQLSDGSYGSITARSFTRLWLNMYEYFMSGDDNSDTIRDLYISTEESTISETLEAKYTVYSKAGWIADGDEEYYNAQNDAGIVMKDGHPYVLVVLSNAYERFDLLDPLVNCLDQAHSGMAGLGYERASEYRSARALEAENTLNEAASDAAENTINVIENSESDNNKE